jgi:hypothetical protein
MGMAPCGKSGATGTDDAAGGAAHQEYTQPGRYQCGASRAAARVKDDMATRGAGDATLGAPRGAGTATPRTAHGVGAGEETPGAARGAGEVTIGATRGASAATSEAARGTSAATPRATWGAGAAAPSAARGAGAVTSGAMHGAGAVTPGAGRHEPVGEGGPIGRTKATSSSKKLMLVGGGVRTVENGKAISSNMT